MTPETKSLIALGGFVVLLGALVKIGDFYEETAAKEIENYAYKTSRLSEQNELAEMAINGRPRSIKTYAGRYYVTTTADIFNIAGHEEDRYNYHSDWGYLEIAVSKISDVNLLKKIAMKAKEDNVRIAAIKKLSDQSALKEIALNEKFYSDRSEAAARIQGQEILKEIVGCRTKKLMI